MQFSPKFTITLSIANALTSIERTRGFLEAATLSEDWIAKMQTRALILEAHHTTHIEGTHLSLDQSEKLLSGKKLSKVDAEDVRELLNYKKAFDFVAGYLLSQKPITEGLIREIHKKLSVQDIFFKPLLKHTYNVFFFLVRASGTLKALLIYLKAEISISLVFQSLL